MLKTKFARCIYESPSGYKVYQNLFYRWLTLGSRALQTVINRWQPQKPVLYYLPALTFMVKQFPGNTCLFGLGGAGIAHMFPDMPIVIVEKDEEVIDIAKKYFKLSRLKQVTLVPDNAMNYVQNTEAVFSHLLVDLYNANHFPPECTNDLFFSSCKRLLEANGFLAVNLANVQEQKPVLELIKKQFACTMVIPVKKSANIIILAANSMDKEAFIKKIQTAPGFKRLMWVDGWGYVGEYR